MVKDVHNRWLVNALLDPLAAGEAESIALAIEENADYIVLDDMLARRRTISMRLMLLEPLGFLG